MERPGGWRRFPRWAGRWSRSSSRPALPADTGEAPSGMASPDTALPPVSRDLRSPELIEAGMVYVDPDPEIGAPPPTVGWVEQPAARLEPEGDPGGPSDAPRLMALRAQPRRRRRRNGAGDAEIGDALGAGAPTRTSICRGGGGSGGTEDRRGGGGHRGAGVAEAEGVALAGLGGEPESEPGPHAAPAPAEAEARRE